MRALPQRLLLRLLRRREDEIARRLPLFRIDAQEERARVLQLGAAFLGGYHAMLEAAELGEVARRAAVVDPHWRPFFFEGAAMGYLPRGYLRPTCTPERAEADLIGLDAAPLYLYYVGLGFWYGFRHPRRPARLYDLTRHLTPLYAPLTWDGFGFQVGFFDLDPGRPERALARLERCPRAERRWIHQGFGRALFFVFHDDATGFERLCGRCGADVRGDLEFGRALACGFTGVDRPDSLREFLAAAPDEARKPRSLGLAWALAARQRCDPAYFEACLARASQAARTALRPLPERCETARGRAQSYADWQERASN